MSLGLTPTKDLIKELMDRTNGLVLAFGQTESGNQPVIKTRWSNKVSWIEMIGMADLLKYHLQQEYEKQSKVEEDE